jgi:hypothetical protein
VVKISLPTLKQKLRNNTLSESKMLLSQSFGTLQTEKPQIKREDQGKAKFVSFL